MVLRSHNYLFRLKESSRIKLSPTRIKRRLAQLNYSSLRIHKAARRVTFARDAKMFIDVENFPAVAVESRNIIKQKKEEKSFEALESSRSMATIMAKPFT